LTIAAVIVAIVNVLLPVRADGGRAASASKPAPAIRYSRIDRKRRPDLTGLRDCLFRLGGECLGLGDPGVGATRKTDFFADLVRRGVIELGKLPIVKDAKVVELLLDRARHAGQLLEIVGGAAGAGEALEAAGSRCGRDFLGDRLGGSTDIDARIALPARDAVDGGARDEVAVERNRTTGVVIARH